MRFLKPAHFLDFQFFAQLWLMVMKLHGESRIENALSHVYSGENTYCDLLSSVRRAVSKCAFDVSKRTFAVSKQAVLTVLVLSLNNEIDTLSRFERNVWLLYSKYSI